MQLPLLSGCYRRALSEVFQLLQQQQQKQITKMKMETAGENSNNNKN
jgi:hypothetical protein